MSSSLSTCSAASRNARRTNRELQQARGFFLRIRKAPLIASNYSEAVFDEECVSSLRQHKAGGLEQSGRVLVLVIKTDESVSRRANPTRWRGTLTIHRQPLKKAGGSVFAQPY